MFWKQTSLSSNIQPWQMLQWWRTPQEYIPWTIVDLKEPFQQYFQEMKKNVFVEFDDEVSILSSVTELRTALEELWKKAASISKGFPSQLLLKSTQISTQKFMVKPFIQQSALLTFLPPKESITDVHLTLAFLDPAQSSTEFDKRLRYWADRLETDQIDAFVFRQSMRLFRELLQDQAKKMPYDALIDSTTQFEALVMDADQQLSQEYLKKVWKIPLFIFANQPEQAAFTRLLLQKSFQNQLPEIQETATRISGE